MSARSMFTSSTPAVSDWFQAEVRKILTPEVAAKCVEAAYDDTARMYMEKYPEQLALCATKWSNVQLGFTDEKEEYEWIGSIRLPEEMYRANLPGYHPIADEEAKQKCLELFALWKSAVKHRGKKATLTLKLMGCPL